MCQPFFKVYLDPVSLRVFRIFMGCIVAFDGYFRILNIGHHYSELGIYPMSVAGRVNVLCGPDPGQWSLMFLSSALWWQGFCLISYLFSGIFLIRGHWLLVVSFLAWCLHSSIVVRAPSLNNGGDTVLRLLLFWNALIAAEQRFVKRPSTTLPNTVSGYGVLGFTLQISFLYWFSAILKSHATWRNEFSAVTDALHLGSLTTSFGAWLSNFPVLGYWATRCTLLLEEIGPFLIFAPARYWRWRMGAVFGFIGFHLALLAPSMHLGLFPFVCAAAWLAFIPSEVWIQVQRQWPSVKCIFDSMVFTPPSPRPQVQSGSCKRSVFIRLIGISSIGYIFVWNVVSVLPKERTLWFSPYAKAPGMVLGLRQRWSLFAARPSTRDGWMIAEAKLVSGRVVDLFTDNTPDFVLPMDEIASRYPSFRWRKHLVSLFLNDRLRASEALHHYLVRQWNTSHQDSVVNARLIFRYRDLTRPDLGILQTEIYPTWQAPMPSGDQLEKKDEQPSLSQPEVDPL